MSGSSVQPRFEDGKAIVIAGIAERYSGTNSGIPAQWQRFMPEIGRVPGQIGRAAYGVVFDSLNDAVSFGYLTGVEVAQDCEVPAKFGHLEIPAHRYAVFSHNGHVSAIPRTMRAIFQEWLPASGHELVSDGPDFFERYGEDFDPRTGTGDIEIWLPVRQAACENTIHNRSESKTMPMQVIVPYLTVRDASAAIDFYKKAFNAQENSRAPAQDGKRIMHADITINGGSVFLMDEFPEHGDHGGAKAPNGNGGTPVSMVINYAKPGDIDVAFGRAVEAGCKGVQKPEDTFWEARFAIVVDPYGHTWMLNAPLPAKKN